MSVVTTLLCPDVLLLSRLAYPSRAGGGNGRCGGGFGGGGGEVAETAEAIHGSEYDAEVPENELEEAQREKAGWDRVMTSWVYPGSRPLSESTEGESV